MNYYDVYITDPKDIKEGHAFDEIYARVPVRDTTNKTVTWLCRVNDDQYLHLSKAGLAKTWKDVDAKAKRTIKDTTAANKVIPSIVFGGTLVSPGSPVLVPDKTPIDANAKPVEPPKEKPPEELPPPKEK
jgi:hypothetical protein